MAAGLLLAATVVGLIGFGRLLTAVLSFEIEPVPARSEVTIAERPLAVWTRSSDPTVFCSATDARGQESLRGTTWNQDVTLGATTWRRLGTVGGLPGTTHALECSSATATAPLVGVSDAPRVLQQARSLVLWTSGAVALAGTAVVSGLLVLLRRRPAQ